MREAYRLLRKSIIHVETDEVELDDIQPPTTEEDDAADAADDLTGSNGGASR